MSNILLLYNRLSGRQDFCHLLKATTAIFEASGWRVTAQELDFENNPFEQLDKEKMVVVAGGDGSLGYVAEQMLRHEIDLPLGIIPAGTANDFAAMLGIPHDPRKAARHIIKSSVRAVDVGEVNGKIFVNIFSFGAFTTTSQHTLNSHKRHFGRLAYIAKGLREIFSIKSLPLHIRCDGEQVRADVVSALIFNGRTAGNFPLAPTAECDDGVLDGVFILKGNTLGLIVDSLRYLCGGSPASFRHLRGRNFRISTPLTAIDTDTDTDGECGPDFPLEVKCLHHALKIKG